MGCNFLGIQFVALLFVHPHTGVWVEMINQEYSKLYQISSSPCGVWVEIPQIHSLEQLSSVHPHTGVWVVIKEVQGEWYT